MPERDRITVHVWSDYVCPFCYLEAPVLDRLRAEYGQALNVRWHAFELRPDPVPTLDPAGEYLRTTWERAVYPMAEQRGMTLRLPPVQPRSRLALEAAEFARERGRFEAMNTALFRAFFEDGRDIGRVEVLAEVAEEVGLDAEELRSLLDQGRYTDLVLQDEQLARVLGVHAVPTLLVAPEGAALERAEALSGAQPLERVRGAVERARHGSPAPRRWAPTLRPGLPTLPDPALQRTHTNGSGA